MTTKRIVLYKPTKAGEVAESDLSSIASLAQVVDSIGSRAFLVDIREELVDALRERLEGWTVDEERIQGHPKDK